MSTPTHDGTLDTARRGLRTWRWTAVITTAGTGMVMVALASRVGDASAVVAGILAATAFVLAILRALTTDRRWRQAMSSTRTRPASVRPPAMTRLRHREDRTT